MNRIVFLFPGQGSQEVGMGQELFGDDPFFQELIELASKETNEDLQRICLKGPQRKLNESRIVQPLLVAVSLGYWHHLSKKGLSADYILGHSLGEITALTAAEVIDGKTAIAIASKRGMLMDQAASECEGAMWACLATPPDIVENLLQDLGLLETLVIANVNTPTQVVVTGDRHSFEVLAAEITKKGGRYKKLNVAGPWHSPFMKSASEEFEYWLESVPFKPAEIPLILNNTAVASKDPINIKSQLASSLTHPVFFHQCLNFCREKRCNIFIEIGPGRVLSGLVRSNGLKQGVQTYPANNLRGIERILQDL